MNAISEIPNSPHQVENNAGQVVLPRLLPYLLTASFCLWIVADDARNIPPITTLILTVVVALAGVGLLHLVLRLLVRSHNLPEICLTLLVGFTVFFGWFSSFVGGLYRIDFWTTFYCWCLIFVALIVAATKWRRRVGLALRPLSYVFAILLAMLSIQIGFSTIQDMVRLARLERDMHSVDFAGGIVDESPERQPDIYFLIFDAYARGDVLKDVYGFDNRLFLDDLQNRGFFVGSQSRSNYHLTELSVASTLNLDYLQVFELDKFHTRMPVHAMMDNSLLGRFLKSRGYETNSVESGKTHTECKSFDRYFATGFAFNDYQDALLSATAIYPVMQLAKRFIPTPAELHRQRVLATFEAVKSVADNRLRPQFVFSHLLSPHPPFVFDQEGKSVCLQGPYLLADGWDITGNDPARTAAYRNAYQQQLQFINSQIIALVDHIQANQRPSIIVLQSDHGPRSRFDVAEGLNSDYREGFGILNAIYLTGSHASDLEPTITSVNTFRAILNHQFGTKLNLLDDRSYFENAAWQFTDVTDVATAPQTKLSSSGLADNRKPQAHQ